MAFFLFAFSLFLDCLDDRNCSPELADDQTFLFSGDRSDSPDGDRSFQSKRIIRNEAGQVDKNIYNYDFGRMKNNFCLFVCLIRCTKKVHNSYCH